MPRAITVMGDLGRKKATFHHNLIMSHNSRLPRFNGSRYHKEPELEIVDFRNNVVYNWKSNSSYAGEEGKHKDGIIDSQKDVGGWPVLKSGEAPKDTDRDGMPDAWEVKNGLDPNDPSDASGYDLDKAYTNVEVYLNGLLYLKK